IDYLGEAGVWPAHANESGLLDLAGFRKNQFYFRKALWTDAPMVYLSTSGIPIRRQPATMPAFPAIHCYTNCDSVELFHDGQSLGSKSHADGEIIVWPTEFTSGVMKAVGKKGDATTTFELKHAGPPAKIELLPDISSLQANGRAVAQIEVQITDADGTLVPDAENLLTCALSGPAQIIGIENGNIYGTESNKGPSHSVHQGKMLIYLQSLKTAGELKLTISSPNLEDSSITLPVH
ncbi:MAG TPA: DUF4982 domain-containing protein, partial [Tepidisphaeraceae bacterium]|nr:DUF4982 domain-containing protein [Tepidisphaeraceae bacterium]